MVRGEAVGPGWEECTGVLATGVLQSGGAPDIPARGGRGGVEGEVGDVGGHGAHGGSGSGSGSLPMLLQACPHHIHHKQQLAL